MPGKSYTYNDLQHLFDQSLQRLDEFERVPDDLFILKPDSGNWSADEVCQHLVRFNSLYIRQADRAVDSLTQFPEANGPFKPTLLAYLFARFLEPPYKLKINTLAPMYPYDTMNRNPQKVRKELHKIISTFSERVTEFQQKNLHLEKVKGRNPIAKFLPMSLIDFILVLDAHQRRHYWQIEQTLYKLSGQKY